MTPAVKSISLAEFESLHQPQSMPAFEKSRLITDEDFIASRMDWDTLWAKPPEPKEFILPGFLQGTVGALISPGGTGKSFWALEAAIAIATVYKFNLLGLQCPGGSGGRVVLLSLEDPIREVGDRAYRITKNLSPDLQEKIKKNLDVMDLFGKEPDLMCPVWFERIAKYCTGAKLIIVDTLSRSHRLDENKNSDMAQLMGRMDALARTTGASVLFIHHISKGSNKEGKGNEATASRGASVLVDNARWVGFLQQMTSTTESSVPETDRWKYVKFGVSKINYGAPVPESWLERDGGVLFFSKINTVNRGFDVEAVQEVDLNALFGQTEGNADEEIDF